MKIEIITKDLQEMMSKAIKGASNNKLLPITSLITLKKKEDKIKLITTDGSNRLEVFRQSISTGDDQFYAVVKADTLYKLVAGITTEKIKLKINENFLEIKGNGTYKIEIPIDEDGKAIIFPTPTGDFNTDKLLVNLQGLKVFAPINRAVLPRDGNNVIYTNYYLGDEIITTDSYRACVSPARVFDNPKLLSPELVQLLLLNEDDNLYMQEGNGKLKFTGKEIIIYGEESKGITEFPKDSLKEMLPASPTGAFTLNRQLLIGALDRLTPFISQYASNAIRLEFTKEALNIASTDENGIEVITPNEIKMEEEYKCGVNVVLFKTMLAGLPAEAVTIEYTKDGKCMVIKANGVSQILALLNLED